MKCNICGAQGGVMADNNMCNIGGAHCGLMKHNHIYVENVGLRVGL